MQGNGSLSTTPRLGYVDDYSKTRRRKVTTSSALTSAPLPRILAALGALVIVLWILSRPHHDEEHQTYSFDIPISRNGVLDRLKGKNSLGDQAKARPKHSAVGGSRLADLAGTKIRPSYQLPEFNCNPFEELGRLIVDVENTTANVWAPFDRTCPPSNYMKDLYRPPGDTSPLNSVDLASPRRPLPWLLNRTVVIHGDSIDRFHLKDFCELVGGELTLIDPSHPASPAPYRYSDHLPAGTPEDDRRRRREKEQVWEGRPREGHLLTNPWVCDVREYGSTLINVFTWGFQGAEEFFETERWYHPPATWTDRLDAITMPLLDNLAKHYDRPQIRFPDLVEINSGYWDLRKYTEEDFVAAGWTTRPYPEDSLIPYKNLQPGREVTWEREARKAIKLIARSFRGQDGTAASGPTILWRSLHHPPRHNYAPYNRVFALDNLARQVIADLRTDATSPFKAQEPSEKEDLNLEQRLRIDESGRLMLGQEQMFRDLLHPLAVPGSYLWGNVMLYELKRAIKGINRRS